MTKRKANNFLVPPFGTNTHFFAICTTDYLGHVGGRQVNYNPLGAEDTNVKFILKKFTPGYHGCKPFLILQKNNFKTSTANECIGFLNINNL